MNKELSQEEIRHDRRMAIRTLGMGVLAAVGAASAANAQSLKLEKSISGGRLNLKALPKNLQVNPAILELKMADPRAIKALHLTARLPGRTPITQMGLDPKYARVLTDAARNLTKTDLETLATGKNTAATRNLTVADIKSVQVAFGGGFDAGELALDVSCCCCTPCCCAATSPVREAA